MSRNGYKAFYNNTVYVPIAEDGTVASFRNKKVSVTERVFDVSAEVDFSIDHNYGADIDGNRGMKQEFVEDTTITDISETDEDGTVTPVIFADLPKDIQEYIYTTAEENSHE